MPKPVLQAMVLADQVYQDRTTGKFIIAGTFGTIVRAHISSVLAEGQIEVAGTPRVWSQPITQIGSPYLYLALLEVQGQVPLQLKFVDLADASVLFEARIDVESADPVALAEYVLPMPPLPVNKPGAFSLDLLYENEILGSWRINMKNMPQRSEGEVQS